VADQNRHQIERLFTPNELVLELWNTKDLQHKKSVAQFRQGVFVVLFAHHSSKSSFVAVMCVEEKNSLLLLV
jgi:hypothetical protein